MSGVVVVTGSASGLGRTYCRALSDAGWTVVGADLRETEDVALSVVTDVSDRRQTERLAEEALERFGRIDALVNNAAIGPLGTVLDTDEATFDRIMAVNLKGPYLCSRAVLPHMIRAGGGAIVNVGSGAGWGKPNMAAYSASKGGVFALSAAMAYDFLHHGIRVNTVVPGGGGIISGMSLGRVGGDSSRLGQGAPGTAAGRPATGDDIANAIAFLISPEAEAISGTVIDVGCFAHQGGPVPAKPKTSQGERP